MLTKNFPVIGKYWPNQVKFLPRKLNTFGFFIKIRTEHSGRYFIIFFSNQMESIGSSRVHKMETFSKITIKQQNELLNYFLK